MKKLTVHVHTTDAEHWVTMNGAAVLVDGTEGGGFEVKGGAGGKLQGLKVNPKSMSEPRLNAKTSQFNRPDFKPHEPEPPKPAGLEFRGVKYEKREGEWTFSAGGRQPMPVKNRTMREALERGEDPNPTGAQVAHRPTPAAAPKPPQAAEPSARQYISAAKLDHPSVGALNNATAQKEAAHARLKSINRKDDPLGHLKADSAHRDAVRNEASAREAVEAAANRLGQTTISPAGAKKAAGEAEKLGALKERIGGEAAKADNQGRDLDSVKRWQQIEKENGDVSRADSREAYAQTIKNVPLPDWGQHKGVDVLRSPGSRFVAVPRNGKKTGANFDILDLQKNKHVMTLPKGEAGDWLHRAAKTEYEERTGRMAHEKPSGND